METKATELELLNELSKIFSIDNRNPKTMADRVLMLKGISPKINKVLLETEVVNIRTMPKNIPDLLKVLQTVTIDKIFPQLISDNEDDFKGQYLLDGSLLSVEAEMLIEENVDFDELQSEIMNIRELIKEKGMPNEQYERCRLFFIPEHTVLEDSEMTMAFIKYKIEASLFNELRNRFYIRRDYVGEVKLCPICGKHWSGGHFDESKLCKQLSKEVGKDKPIIKNFNENQIVYELNKSTIKYTLIPNIGEILLKERLEQFDRNLIVEMYPNLDEYDLAVSYKGKKIMLDVKDYKSPEHLAKHFNESLQARNKLSLLGIDKSFIVVMDYRLKLEPNYMNRLKNKLKEENGEDFKEHFISESELFERLKRF